MQNTKPQSHKRPGRPCVPVAQQAATLKPPRSVRLDDARWAKLKALGTDWLEQQIDAANPPK